MIPFPKILKHIFTYLLLSIFIGIVFGLMLGKSTQNFVPLSEAIDMFFQAIIILYLPLALLNGLGSSGARGAIRLLIKAVIILLFLWALLILTCLFLNIFIPKALPASLDLTLQGKNLFALLLSYFIPSIPLQSFMQNLLSPLAFFSLLLGIGFMHEKSKEPLLSLLQEGTYILEKVLIWLVFLTPLKAILHFAALVGNFDFNWLKPISFYIATIIATCLFFSFYFLPRLASILTPLKFKELFRFFAFVGLACFATGQPLVAFPFIAEALRRIQLDFAFPVIDWRSTYRLIMPIAFSFAQLGQMLTMFFAFYFASFFHSAIGLSQFFALPFYSIVLSIASPSPSAEDLFILFEKMHFPPQALVYLQNIQSITLDFKVLFSAASVLFLALLVLMLHENKFQKNWKRLASFFFASLVALSTLLYGIHVIFPPKDSYKEFIGGKSLRESVGKLPNMHIASYPTLEERGRFTPPIQDKVLSSILEKKKLRVGFYKDVPPYCYYNASNELMGFDVALMSQLANELEVDLELVPMDIERLGEDLNAGIYDIAIGNIMMDFSRILNLSFSNFYQENTCVLMSLRSESKKYENLEQIKSNPSLKIGTAGAMYPKAVSSFPNAKIIDDVTWEKLVSREIDLYFGSNIVSRFRALAEPELISLDFGDAFGEIYICYGMAKVAVELKSFLNEWLSLQKLSGFYQRQYNYWIEGALK
jgi:Na+/H+-dicarboxylate symporter/ABC-type amino acid transport substrate-binding protein